MQERVQLYKEFKEVLHMNDFAHFSRIYDIFVYSVNVNIFEHLHLCLFL